MSSQNCKKGCKCGDAECTKIYSAIVPTIEWIAHVGKLYGEDFSKICLELMPVQALHSNLSQFANRVYYILAIASLRTQVAVDADVMNFYKIRAGIV